MIAKQPFDVDLERRLSMATLLEGEELGGMISIFQTSQKLQKENDIRLLGYTFRMQNYVRIHQRHSNFGEWRCHLSISFTPMILCGKEGQGRQSLYKQHCSIEILHYGSIKRLSIKVKLALLGHNLPSLV